jgi:hypothetical protein
MTVNWRPLPGVTLEATVEQVASHIRARTKDSNGVELGTFTEETRPTAAQAQEAIDNAVRILKTRVMGVGPECQDAAQAAVALLAAADIERSYFPEQSRSDRSVYIYLRDAADAALEGVALCVLGDLPGGDDTGAAFGSATLTVVSGVVADHYAGRLWPPGTLPVLPEPPDELPPDELPPEVIE